MADFLLIAKRTLPEEEFQLFRYHFLLGADWKLCCLKLNMERGNFFHAVYRIEQKLGRVFRELEPYGLFPLDEYFHGERVTARATIPGIEGQVFPIRPPLAERAPRLRGRPPKARALEPIAA